MAEEVSSISAVYIDCHVSIIVMMTWHFCFFGWLVGFFYVQIDLKLLICIEN